MKRINSICLLVIVIILCNSAYIEITLYQKYSGSIRDIGVKDKNITNGISISISKYTVDSDFLNWSNELSDINCNVELCTMEYINSPTEYKFTPVDDLMTKMVQCQKALGANNKYITILKPHIGTISQGDAFNRSKYMPSNVRGFFSNWKETLLWYAAYANSNKIPVLCITCEQELLTDNTLISNWKDITNEIRTKYPNVKLLIAYLPQELQRDIKYKKLGQETLCDYVDIIGINTYVNVDRKDNYKNFKTVDEMYSDCKKLFNKPLIITETGCTKYSDTSNKDFIYPIYLKSNIIDYTDQRTFLDVTLNYMLNNKNISGVYLWHMSSPFSILEDSESKNIIKRWFGSDSN